MSVRRIEASMNAGGGFDFTAQAGLTGEHNASELVINLNEDFASGWDFLALAFSTCAPGGCFSSNTVTDENSSPVYLSGGSVVCPLSEELTATGVLCVQVAAYKTDGTHCSAVRKSGILTVSFEPSVTGGDAFLTADAGFENEVRTAMQALRSYAGSFADIHTHPNSAVLGALGESAGKLCFNGERVCEEPVLPTASLSQKGGVKPGFGVEMTGDYLGVSSDFMAYCAAYCACKTSADSRILHVLTGSPAEFDYIDGENLGITGYLYELDDIYPRLCLIPTQDGTIEWLDYSDRLNTLNVEKSVIYLFEADSRTGQITVTTKQPNEI